MKIEKKRGKTRKKEIKIQKQRTKHIKNKKIKEKKANKVLII